MTQPFLGFSSDDAVKKFYANPKWQRRLATLLVDELGAVPRNWTGDFKIVFSEGGIRMVRAESTFM